MPEEPHDVPVRDQLDTPDGSVRGVRDMTGVVWTPDSLDDARAVHSCLREIAALSTHPAKWAGQLPDAINDSIQNLLMNVLRSQRVLVPGGSARETSRLDVGSLHADTPTNLETQLMQASANEIATTLRRTTLVRRSDEAAGSLQARVSQQAAIARLSHEALTDIPLNDLLQEGVRVVRDGLQADCSELLELAPDGSSMLLSAGSGWKPGMIGVTHVPADPSSLAGFTLDAGMPVVMQDLRTETRFEPWRVLREHGVVSSINVILHGSDRPFGVLGAHSRTRRVFTSDDVHFLQSIANLLAVALQQRQAESDREHLLARTNAAHAEAERVSRDKTQHLASMSHELRTPLNAIAGYVEMMEMGIHGPLTSAQRSDLGRIRHNQRYLLRLINSVLTFMKLDSGHIEYELDVVSVSEMLSAVEETVRPLMQAKQLKYRKRKPQIELRVVADGGKVQQILVNLLANATKFTDPKGVVEVDFVADDRVVRTQVRDSGIGIPSVELERVFEPFVQVKDPGARMVEGTGLGLAISRQFAEGMHGRLFAESERGKGSTFTLELPRSR